MPRKGQQPMQAEETPIEAVPSKKQKVELAGFDNTIMKTLSQNLFDEADPDLYRKVLIQFSIGLGVRPIQLISKLGFTLEQIQEAVAEVSPDYQLRVKVPRNTAGKKRQSTLELQEIFSEIRDKLVGIGMDPNIVPSKHLVETVEQRTGKKRGANFLRNLYNKFLLPPTVQEQAE